ncbi:retrovirus-related pol polyprotein from transposon TNT 1-94 [Tanacetum coccineum]
MLLKEQDPLFVKHKVNTKPINYAILQNDYYKRFVRQTDLYSEHAYWKATSVPPLDPSHSSTTVIVEVPKELPTVSMVNTSLKKLNNAILNDFDQKTVVLNQNAPSFTQLFELSELKAQSQAKDTVIVKLKEQIKSFKGNVEDSSVKMDMDEIETLNIELEHREWTKLNLKKQDNFDCVGINSNDCMSSDNVCVSNAVNVVKSRAKKNKPKKDIWKPTGKVFTQIGYTWSDYRKSSALDNKTPKPVVTLVYSRKPRKSKTSVPVNNYKVIKSVTANNSEPIGQIVSGILEYRLSSKHMTGDRSQLTNFVNKFLGTVKFGNDHVAKIMGYGDYQIGNVTISRVYYVEGLGHNLFSVGQFCDSNLEVAFRQHTCYIRNLEGVDLLTGSRGDNLYTLSLEDMMASSPICLLSKASKTKSWLWHRRLSYLNFGAINHLARYGLVRGLPKLKFKKDYLCSACALGKSTKKPHKPKSEDTNQEKLYLLHMDLCGPMRVASVNMIQVRLKETVRRIRTDNGTEFVNHTSREYYEKVGISHETSVAPSPQQNAVAIACYTQIRSMIRRQHGKTPYELLHSKPPDLSYLHVFGALCYPTNDSENLGKLQPKANIGIFIGYAPTKKAFRIYNRRTRRIIETIHVDFDELTAMAFEHISSGPAIHEMTPTTISSGLMPNPHPSTPFVPPSRTDWNMLFQPLFDEFLNPSPSVDHPAPEVVALSNEVIALVLADSTGSPSSTTVDQDAPSLSNSQTTSKTKPPIILNDVEEDNHDIEVAHMGNDPYFGVPIPEIPSDQSSSSDSIHTIVHPDH